MPKQGTRLSNYNRLTPYDRLQVAAFHMYFWSAFRTGASVERAFASAICATTDTKLFRALKDKADLVQEWIDSDFDRTDFRQGTQRWEDSCRCGLKKVRLGP